MKGQDIVFLLMTLSTIIFGITTIFYATQYYSIMQYEMYKELHTPGFGFGDTVNGYAVDDKYMCIWMKGRPYNDIMESFMHEYGHVRLELNDD